MRRRMWLVLVLTAVAVLSGPPASVPTLVGQALGAFAVLVILLIWFPEQVARWRRPSD